MRMPSRPPSTDTKVTSDTSRSKPRMRSAGIVTPTPKASDSPADPAVWTMLFSRMVALRRPSLDKRRKNVMESTATGMEALTVSPTLRTK
jgi:hypothetical protein